MGDRARCRDAGIRKPESRPRPEDIAANLDLARRQQRVTVELLAQRADLSVPTVRKPLNTGAGTLENFLRIARILGLLDAAVEATDPLNTPIGKLRADEATPKRARY